MRSASTSPSNPLLLVGVFFGDSAVGKQQQQQQHHHVGEQIQAIMRVPVTWLVMNHHIVPRQLKVPCFAKNCHGINWALPPNFLPRHPASLNWKTKPSQSGTQITKDDGDMEQVLVTGIGGFLKWGVPTSHQSGCSILSF